MKPKLRSDLLNSEDVMLITLSQPWGQFNLINAYSDSNGSAIRTLLASSPLPPIGYLGGDFNCSSILWGDDGCRRSSPLAKDLDHFATTHFLEYQLGNGRVPTHFPDNGSRPSILDLVFLNESLVCNAMVTIGKRGESNHCPILTFIDFPFTVEPLPPRIKAGSEEEAEFIDELVTALSAIPIPPEVSR